MEDLAVTPPYHQRLIVLGLSSGQQCRFLHRFAQQRSGHLHRVGIPREPIPIAASQHTVVDGGSSTVGLLGPQGLATQTLQLWPERVGRKVLPRVHQTELRLDELPVGLVGPGLRRDLLEHMDSRARLVLPLQQFVLFPQRTVTVCHDGQGHHQGHDDSAYCLLHIHSLFRTAPPMHRSARGGIAKIMLFRSLA